MFHFMFNESLTEQLIKLQQQQSYDEDAIRDISLIVNDGQESTAAFILRSLYAKFGYYMEDSCPICMDYNIYTTLPCGHKFCTPCINSWAKHKWPNVLCPLCKSYIYNHPKDITSPLFAFL